MQTFFRSTGEIKSPYLSFGSFFIQSSSFQFLSRSGVDKIMCATSERDAKSGADRRLSCLEARQEQQALC